MGFKTKFFLGTSALVFILTCCWGIRSAGASCQRDMSKILNYTNVMPIAVIGSGPAGLMAAIYGVRGGKDTFVIEGNKPGGLLMDTTDVENWPGETLIKGPEIIEKMRSQAKKHGVRFVQDAIERVDFSEWPFKLYTEHGDTIHAMTVIIATGASPKKLDASNVDHYWGSGVTACAVCDGSFFKGQEVVVVGGGDSAVEEAIQLTPYASKITILVRKDQMRAAPSMQNRLSLFDSINMQYNVEVTKVLGDGNQVTGVELYNHKTKQLIEFPTSGVFLAIGHTPNSKLFKGQLAMDEAGYIEVQGRTQYTSVPGVFAAGDVEDHRYRQASTSAGTGANAGLDAVRYLDEQGFTPTLASKFKTRLFGCADHDPAPILPASNIWRLETICDFDQVMAKTQGLVVVDFWAETCPSCKQMLPVFEAVADEFKGKVIFATVDIDKAVPLVDKLFVQKVPCLLVFKNGSLLARYSNPMGRKDLTAFIQRFVDEM